MWTKKFWRRVLLVEVVLFGIVGLFCLLTGFKYGVALVLSGALVMVPGFMGSSSASRLEGYGIGSNTLEQQMVRDLSDYEQINRTHAMFNDVIILCGIPMLSGILLLVLL